MTIENKLNKVVYIGDGTTTVFDYPFRVDDAEDMHVFIDLSEVSNWTITGLGNENGGQVTFDSAPAVNEVIVMMRRVDKTQNVDYQPYDKFPANTHEHALDKLTMISQDLQEQLDRALLVSPEFPPDAVLTLPPYDPGKGLVWHETEHRFDNSIVKINGIVSAAQQARDEAIVAKDAAETSAANAAVSETFAYEWAQEAEDVEVQPGEYSAYHWAKKAEEIVVDVHVDSLYYTDIQRFQARSWGVAVYDDTGLLNISLDTGGMVALWGKPGNWNRGTRLYNESGDALLGRVEFTGEDGGAISAFLEIEGTMYWSASHSSKGLRLYHNDIVVMSEMGINFSDITILSEAGINYNDIAFEAEINTLRFLLKKCV